MVITWNPKKKCGKTSRAGEKGLGRKALSHNCWLGGGCQQKQESRGCKPGKTRQKRNQHQNEGRPSGKGRPGAVVIKNISLQSAILVSRRGKKGNEGGKEEKRTSTKKRPSMPRKSGDRGRSPKRGTSAKNKKTWKKAINSRG